MLTGGSANQLELDRSAPAGLACLVLGLAATNTPLLGGILVPNPLVTLVLVTDAEGRSTYPLAWPTGAPAGVPLHAQAWLLDPPQPSGVAASNAVRGISQ